MSTFVSMQPTKWERRVATGLLVSALALVLWWAQPEGDGLETSPDPLSPTATRPVNGDEHDATIVMEPQTVSEPVIFQGVTMGFEPPCFEDEAYIVVRDPNPDHGLTWHCVSREHLYEMGG